MDPLQKTVAEVRARIQKYSTRRRLNEQNTKATLIEPVLRALGWDVEDLDEVQREYKVKRRDRPVDYALLALRSPRLFIEAKGLGEDLHDRRWTNQIMGYATVATSERATTTGAATRVGFASWAASSRAAAPSSGGARSSASRRPPAP